MFEIEKNAPLEKSDSKTKAIESALNAMDVGDSFKFPAKAVPSHIYGLAKGVGRKVAVRKVDDAHYRVFRTA